VQAVSSSGTVAGIFLLLLLIILPVPAVDLAEQYFNDGVNFSKLGQYSDAVASYDKAIFIKGSNAVYWNNRGMALDNLGRYTDAITSYEKALAVKPDYVDAWNNRGVSLRKLGRFPDAIGSYDKALAINPDYAEVWLNRGVALDYIGRYTEAVASYDKALALNPDYTEALENREITLRRKSQSDQTTMIAAIIFIALVALGAFVYIRYQKFSEQKVIVLPSHEDEDGDGTNVPKSRLITLAGLCSVINKNGISILDDPEKVAAELNDLCEGEYKKERDVLILALKENIPRELLKSHHKVTLGNTSKRLRKRLIENHGIPDERAQWALETWEKALGIQETGQ
jgi:tetratricopeptide (TPR) repeat protein